MRGFILPIGSARPGLRVLLALVWALLPAALLVMPATAFAQEDEAAQAQSTDKAIGTSREALAKWVEVRQQLSKEQSEWEIGRQLLLDRIEVVKGEIEDVKATIGEQNTVVEELEAELEKLRARNEKLKQSSELLTAAIEKMEGRTLALIQRAPEPLREEVRPLAQQIPGYVSDKAKADQDKSDQDTPESTEKAEQEPTASSGDSASAEGEAEAEQKPEEEEKKLPLTLRFQSVVGVLNRMNTFNTKIHDASEQITLDDGSTVGGTTLFLGLGQSYFVSPDDTVAGFGYPTDQGWVWQQDDTIAPNVREAIEVMKNDKPAVYVNLPVEVK